MGSLHAIATASRDASHRVGSATRVATRRIAVREALRALRGDGPVAIEPHRAARVVPSDADAAR